jgi:cyanobactin maturation PatA/PatG family protease
MLATDEATFVQKGPDRRPVPELHACSTPFPSPPLPGIEEIWAQTHGDERVCVAILDGPVDRSHPSLRDAKLQHLDGPAPAQPDTGPASRHGTHVASIIFGQHGGSVPGIAPRCRGVVIPIFESIDASSFQSCSQLDLARALTEAVLAGANVINVSGGQFSPAGTAHPFLTDVVRDCARQGVLIVAASGNQGCECLHVPAALDGVLAVGAMDKRGEPLAFSNWGGPYLTQGVLAPGERVLGAVPNGGVEWADGTSYATALVSGVVALFASLQIRRGQQPKPQLVRAALLEAARRRRPGPGRDRGPYLAGPLDLLEATAILTRSSRTMTETNEVQASDRLLSRVSEGPPALAERMDKPNGQTEQAAPREASQLAEKPAEKPAGCGCGGSAGGPRLVYALGQLGYDFPSEARLDSVVQKMAAQAGLPYPERGLAFDQRRMLAHLDKNPWEAAAIEWTLGVDGTPLYAIRPIGPFGADIYRELRRFLKEQIEEGVERISVPGVLVGKATLLSGQSVPMIMPELRGMYSWTTAALAEAVAGPLAADAAEVERNGHAQKRDGVRNFLARVYHEVRNLGLTPQDRALNFAATNAFEMGQIFTQAIRERMELDRVAVVPSPIGRPGSDCWDVEVSFFYPERQVQTVRKVYRFTVDVSDNVPVTVGTMRSWFTR